MVSAPGPRDDGPRRGPERDRYSCRTADPPRVLADLPAPPGMGPCPFTRRDGDTRSARTPARQGAGYRGAPGVRGSCSAAGVSHFRGLSSRVDSLQVTTIVVAGEVGVVRRMNIATIQTLVSNFSIRRVRTAPSA